MAENINYTPSPEVGNLLSVIEGGAHDTETKTAKESILTADERSKEFSKISAEERRLAEVALSYVLENIPDDKPDDKNDEEGYKSAMIASLVDKIGEPAKISAEEDETQLDIRIKKDEKTGKPLITKFGMPAIMAGKKNSDQLWNFEEAISRVKEDKKMPGDIKSFLIDSLIEKGRPIKRISIIEDENRGENTIVKEEGTKKLAEKKRRPMEKGTVLNKKDTLYLEDLMAEMRTEKSKGKERMGEKDYIISLLKENKMEDLEKWSTVLEARKNSGLEMRPEELELIELIEETAYSKIKDRIKKAA